MATFGAMQNVQSTANLKFNALSTMSTQSIAREAIPHGNVIRVLKIRFVEHAKVATAICRATAAIFARVKRRTLTTKTPLGAKITKRRRRAVVRD